MLTLDESPVPANTHTLLDQCSFELINICGMIQNEDDNADWVQTLSSPSDPDQTLEGLCKGTERIHSFIDLFIYLNQKSGNQVTNSSYFIGSFLAECIVKPKD